MSIQLPKEVFGILPETLKHRGISFQKKIEFHITLFSGVYNLESCVSDTIDDILNGYIHKEIGDIEIGTDLYHIQKGEKYSLVNEICSSQIIELLADMKKKLLGLISVEDMFLHTTVYTTTEYPGGISLNSIEDFKKYNRGRLVRF